MGGLISGEWTAAQGVHQQGLDISARLAACDDGRGISAPLNGFFAWHAVQQPEYRVAAAETGDDPHSVIESDSGDLIMAENGDSMIGFAHVEEKATPPYPAVFPHNGPASQTFSSCGNIGEMAQDACFRIQWHAGQNYATRNTSN